MQRTQKPMHRTGDLARAFQKYHSGRACSCMMGVGLGREGKGNRAVRSMLLVRV
jgi:hypothetical protein